MPDRNPCQGSTPGCSEARMVAWHLNEAAPGGWAHRPSHTQSNTYVGDVCLLTVGVRGGRPGLSVFALGSPLRRREAEGHEHADHGTDAARTANDPQVSRLRKVVRSNIHGNGPRQAVLQQ